MSSRCRSGAETPAHPAPLVQADFERLATELLDAVEKHREGADGFYFTLHGAMGATGELDPEGYLLQEVRRLVGPDLPIVISLDLHGILTRRMLENCDALTLLHTYPHVDFADTGARAARLLLRILDEGLRPSSPGSRFRRWSAATS